METFLLVLAVIQLLFTLLSLGMACKFGGFPKGVELLLIIGKIVGLVLVLMNPWPTYAIYMIIASFCDYLNMRFRSPKDSPIKDFPKAFRYLELISGLAALAAYELNSIEFFLIIIAVYAAFFVWILKKVRDMN